MYCVYLTTYRGNKLPPFYIGSSSCAKVLGGYHGTVASTRYRKTWLKELKEHPELFQTRALSQHFSTRREALAVESRLQKKLKVVRSPLYINQAIAAPNGFFGMTARGADSPKFGKALSAEQKLAMSLARRGVKTGPCPAKGQKGEKNGMYGRVRTVVEREKMANTRRKRSKEQNLSAYSRTKSDAEKQKISAFQKIHSIGAGNPRARHWHLTSPTGEVFNLHGNFKKWCAEHGLPSGSPVLRVDGEVMQSGKWSGWKVQRL